MFSLNLFGVLQKLTWPTCILVRLLFRCTKDAEKQKQLRVVVTVFVLLSLLPSLTIYKAEDLKNIVCCYMLLK